MHIEYGGGMSGIKKYLEDAYKAGRDLGHRNDMDERVILEGNLDVTHSIIESMNNAGQRYLHITPSFSERDLPVETLRAIITDYKTLLMAAYKPEEYDFYAEAQLARIKSFTDQTSGEVVQRLDHIHIVIPQVNLVTGEYLNPLGLAKNNLHFLDAIQEHINQKYGLVSPKDRPRDNVSEADIIHRSRLDNFKKGKVQAFKDQLFERIIADNPRTTAELASLAATLGESKIVNAGKKNEYVAVKPAGQERFINLRDDQFRAEFLALSKQDKATWKAASEKKVGVGKKTGTEYDSLLVEWQERRSKEVKYLNSGSKFYKKYRDASPADQLKMLAEREAHFYEKHPLQEPIHEQADRPAQQHDRKNASDRPVYRQQDVEKIRAEPPSESIHSVRAVFERDLDHHPRAGHDQVLLQGTVPDVMDTERASSDNGLRRVRAAEPAAGRVNPGTGREADTVIGQLLRDKNEELAANKASARPDLQAIKRELDAKRLLASLAQSHNVVATDYEITKGQDGGDRIRHKESKQNLNVSDFMTKHMRLAWPDAERYLQDTYAEQLKQQPRLRVAAKTMNQALWKAFNVDHKADIGRAKKKLTADRNAFAAWKKERTFALKENFYREKAKITGDRSKSPAQRKAEKSLLQMQKVQDDMALKAEFAARNDELKRRAEEIREHEHKNLKGQYRNWLQILAQVGNKDALHELRRLRIEPEEEKPVKGFAISQGQPSKTTLLEQPKLQHQVHIDGSVTYSSAGRALLRDAGNRVEMYDQSREAIEQGLRLAAQKWGPKFALYGDAEFVKNAIRISVETGMNVTFVDPKQEAFKKQYSEQLQQKLAQDAAAQRKGREFIAQTKLEKSAIEAYQIHFKDIKRYEEVNQHDGVDYRIAMRMQATGHSQANIEKAIARNAPVMRPDDDRPKNPAKHAKETAEKVFKPEAIAWSSQEYKDHLKRWKLLEKAHGTGDGSAGGGTGGTRIKPADVPPPPQAPQQRSTMPRPGFPAPGRDGNERDRDIEK